MNIVDRMNEWMKGMDAMDAMNGWSSYKQSLE